MLPLTAVALRLAGLGRWQAVLSKTSRSNEKARETGRESSIEQARIISKMVAVAGRHGFHRANCLQQSVTLWWMLRREGIESDLRVGVRKQSGELQAHAWIECLGVVLNDRADVHESYAPFDRAVIAVNNESL